MRYDIDPGVVPGHANASVYAYWPFGGSPKAALRALMGDVCKSALPTLLIGPDTMVPAYSKEFHTFEHQVHDCYQLAIKECKYLQPGEAYMVGKHGIQKIAV